MKKNFPMSRAGWTRRGVLGASGAAMAAGLLTKPSTLFAAEPIKTAGIYTVPVEQQWVSRIHKAAEAAQAKGEVTYTFSENTANTDYPRVMREYAEQGVKLIVGEIFGVEQEAREVTLEYPDVAFLMGSSFLEDPAYPNLAVFDNYIQDASYLSGIIAGSMTKSGNIGMVGGFPIPEVNRLMHAFMAGAKEMNPDITFQVSFIGSWFDPPKAKETAFAMIENGADGYKFINVGCGPKTSYAAHAPFPVGHTIRRGDFVKVDMGAFYLGYAADFVRSYFAGETTDRHKDIWRWLNEVQMELGMSLKPGMTGGEVFDKGYAMISKHLPKFPREFVGHGLGLGSHEQPRMNHVNKTVLEPNSVYCIEYSYYHDGCRHHTEETFLVTDSGVECWTKDCPRDLVVPL